MSKSNRVTMASVTMAGMTVPSMIMRMIRVTPSPVITMVVMIIMRMVANRGPYHFIPNKQRNGFPEIPEASLCRNPTANSLRQSSKNKQTQHKHDQLKNHKFRDQKPRFASGAREWLRNKDLPLHRLINLTKRRAVQVKRLKRMPRNSLNAVIGMRRRKKLRHLKIGVVANVMKMILLTHFRLSASP
jgi:hypothetical protein